MTQHFARGLTDKRIALISASFALSAPGAWQTQSIGGPLGPEPDGLHPGALLYDGLWDSRAQARTGAPQTHASVAYTTRGWRNLRLMAQRNSSGNTVRIKRSATVACSYNVLLRLR